MALGIFIVCLVAIIYLISDALKTARESQRASALSAAVKNVDCSLRMDFASATSPFYFDVYGNNLTDGTSPELYYRARVTRVEKAAAGAALGLSKADRFYLWNVEFAYPPPAFQSTFRMLSGATNYDP